MRQLDTLANALRTALDRCSGHCRVLMMLCNRVADTKRSGDANTVLVPSPYSYDEPADDVEGAEHFAPYSPVRHFLHEVLPKHGLVAQHVPLASAAAANPALVCVQVVPRAPRDAAETVEHALHETRCIVPCVRLRVCRADDEEATRATGSMPAPVPTSPRPSLVSLTISFVAASM